MTYAIAAGAFCVSCLVLFLCVMRWSIADDPWQQAEEDPLADDADRLWLVSHYREQEAARARQRHSFVYVQCDVPEGTTLREWRGRS